MSFSNDPNSLYPFGADLGPEDGAEITDFEQEMRTQAHDILGRNVPAWMFTEDVQMKSTVHKIDGIVDLMVPLFAAARRSGREEQREAVDANSISTRMLRSVIDELERLAGLLDTVSARSSSPTKFWGMGSVVHAAGGSLGQSRSHSVFDDPAESAKRLADNSPVLIPTAQPSTAPSAALVASAIATQIDRFERATADHAVQQVPATKEALKKARKGLVRALTDAASELAEAEKGSAVLADAVADAARDKASQNTPTVAINAAGPGRSPRRRA